MTYTKKGEKNMKNTNKVAKIVTDRIISTVEEANKAGKKLTWVRAWKRYPYQNYRTHKMFNGVNPLMCNLMGSQGIECMTLKQASELGYHLTDDAKGHSIPIVYCLITEYLKKDKDGNPVLDDNGNQISFTRYSSIYSNEWSINFFEDENGKKPISNIKVENENKQITTPELIINNYLSKNPVKLSNETTGNESYYSPAFDEISIPTINQFKTSNAYYATLFHEMVHSTGHKTRLDRKNCNTFGSPDYSYEELIAEIGSAMLMNLAGIDTDDTEKNSAAYLQNWLGVLKDNPTWLFKATAQAEKAVKLITDGMLDENGTLKKEYLFTPAEETKTPKKPEQTSMLLDTPVKGNYKDVIKNMMLTKTPTYIKVKNDKLYISDSFSIVKLSIDKLDYLRKHYNIPAELEENICYRRLQGNKKTFEVSSCPDFDAYFKEYLNNSSNESEIKFNVKGEYEAHGILSNYFKKLNELDFNIGTYQTGKHKGTKVGMSNAKIKAFKNEHGFHTCDVFGVFHTWSRDYDAIVLGMRIAS